MIKVFKSLLPLIAVALVFHHAKAQSNPNIIRTSEKIYSVGIYGAPLRFEKMIQGRDNQQIVGDASDEGSRMKKLSAPDPKSDLFWNWAACIVTCLNQGGLEVSQEQVMRLANMAQMDRNASSADQASAANFRDGAPSQVLLGTPQDLMFAINKNTPKGWGKASKIFSAPANVDPDVIFDELSAGRPLVLASGATGIEGRAFVISAMSYNINRDAAGNETGITPLTVTLRDPWPRGINNSIFQWSEMVAMTASLYTIKVEFKK